MHKRVQFRLTYSLGLGGNDKLYYCVSSRRRLDGLVDRAGYVRHI